MVRLPTKHKVWLFWLSFVFLLSLVASVNDAEARVGTPLASDARCDAIQGSQAQVDRNRERRLRLGIRATPRRGQVELQGTYRRPQPIEFEGAELHFDGAQYAIQLDDHVDNCPTLLALHRDDSIGKGHQVLMLTPRGALLWARQQLHWWPVSQATSIPPFRHIWRSSFAISYAKTEPKAKRRGKKRRKRHKRRRRRR